MSVWILFILIGAGSSTAVFESKEACLEAGRLIAANYAGRDAGTDMDEFVRRAKLYSKMTLCIPTKAYEVKK